MNRLTLTLVALVVGTTALAQPPQGGEQGGQGQGGGRGGRGGRGGGQGGPGGGFGGGPGGGGFGGAQGGFPGGGGGFGGGMMGGMMGMSRELSAVNIPLRVMTYYLNLSDAQAGKIALIREDMQDAARPQTPQRRPQQDPNADPNAAQNGQGGRPDMQAMMQEMQANVAKAERKAVTDTNAALSEPQRTRLSLLIKALKSLQGEGVRPEAATKLLLNEDQLTALSRSRKMDSVLSPEQLTIAQSYLSPMGRGGFGGGPGGPGGGRGGRGGGGN